MKVALFWIVNIFRERVIISRPGTCLMSFNRVPYPELRKTIKIEVAFFFIKNSLPEKFRFIHN